MLASPPAPARTRTRVLLLHRHQLVADVFQSALSLLSPLLEVRTTADSVVALGCDGTVDVLLAEQSLVPSGLRWHALGNQDGAPWLITLGHPDRAHPAASLAAVRAGAHGWVPPDVLPATLLEAIRVVVTGQLWLPPAHLAHVLRELTHDRRATTSDDAGLTRRERTVLELVAAGRTSHDIADMLLLSPNTVRTHRARLFAKLQVHTAVEAAAWLRRHLDEA